MPTEAKTLFTPEEYLALERKAECKSEYFDGHIFAMPGATYRHNQLAMRVSILIGSHLDGKGCEALGSDMRVHVAENGL